MRMSAIICRCSLSAAESGVTAAPASMTPAAIEKTVRVFMVLLRSDDEVRSPIFHVRRFVVACIERELLPVTDGLQPIGRDAERHEVSPRGDRAALAQGQIVLGGSPLIAVSFDGHGPAGVAFQGFRVLFERRLRRSAQLA